jgi:DNA primase
MRNIVIIDGYPTGHAVGHNIFGTYAQVLSGGTPLFGFNVLGAEEDYSKEDWGNMMIDTFQSEALRYGLSDLEIKTAQWERWEMLCPHCGNRVALLGSETPFWYCYHCGNATFVEELPPMIIGDPYYQEHRLMVEICGKAAEYYSHALYEAEGAEALKYLREKRQLKDSTIKGFCLGYAPDKRQGLTKHLRSLYTDEDILSSGLILENEEGELKDRLRGRIVFPLKDPSGEIVAFSGRTLWESKTTPKYLNTGKSIIYGKNNTLYNYNPNETKEFVLLVEGYLDAISLFENGFTNVVASMGTELSPIQIKLLEGKEVVVMYDSDKAGIRAALKAIDKLLDAGITAHFLLLPNEHDPDSFIREYSKQRMDELIREARSAFTMPELGNYQIQDETVITNFMRYKHLKERNT